MALDLNIALDDGDEHAIPNLNEAVAEEAAVADQEDDQVGGDLQGGANHELPGGDFQGGVNHVLPFDLNLYASDHQGEIHLDDVDVMDQVLQVNGGHNHNAFPFDLNFDDDEEDLQYHPDMQEYGVYAGDVDVVFEQEELDDSDEEDEHQNKNLTKIQRQQIYAALAGKTNNGILRKNATTEVAAMFNVKRARVQAIWRRVKQCRAQGIPIDVRSRKKKNCGRKKKEINLTDVANVPLQQRGTLRSFASASGIPKSTLHKMLKEGLLRRHSNTLKPLLKEENKQSRLRWCLSMLDWHTLPNQPKFIDMRNIVHIDEKWFNTTKRTRTIYMVHWEDDPYRPVQNKNSIDKVMFLAAITRPRYNEEGICTFDGKIGLGLSPERYHNLFIYAFLLSDLI
ncbi:hypothetical protein OsJ_02131 [Oryza sativa Japonica Group]|uniref:DUF7769 domain-containing protein n=1 Tax=Oryza sativa subsp. japonica TaxID=39947 RepID=A2ZU48_ORYSJ|nr:hypothetical protein OsJ_02131 [Oryza sativa Japonica Group]